ncbi:MAG: GlcG/HbpS family heme-binding protein [Streptosporangiaceae bacterium]
MPFAEARALADDARARTLELGKALSIAVVNYGGFIVLIERMDGARPMTADIALAKAYSAAVMQRPTEMLENWRKSDPVFFTQVGRMGHRPIVATKGGVTIKRGGARGSALGDRQDRPGDVGHTIRRGAQAHRGRGLLLPVFRLPAVRAARAQV